MEEIKVGVEEKKKTQGMRRDLGHKVCGRSHHPKFNHFSIFHGKPYHSIFLLTTTYHPFANDVQFGYTEEITFIDHSLG